jgi:RimJ/RimL family protein N-acetyltransferase
VPYITTMIDPDNVPSIKVAERLAMTIVRGDVHFDKPVIVRSVSREDWKQERR